MKETDLFEPVKNWLLNRVGCTEVYGEVGLCDILGLSGQVNIVVETKTSLSFKVIEQAISRKHCGHYVYVAVPKPRSYQNLQRQILKEHGIGLLYMHREYDGENVIRREIKPKMNRQARYSKIRRVIKPYHQNQLGGVKSGEGQTDYSVMIDNIKSYMKRMLKHGSDDGWLDVDTILEDCETYYATPKPSVTATLQASWNTDWCETKKEGRKRYFRYKESAE
ncbi:hypothetical protein HBP99_15010 [Listeria booriae]|uniref:hypothetical protein n=1 Tax=Listeria booriae TaxID=1552123 RepID=UPI001628151F|nr:hypothetical protein [Listeria booriae]MBC1209489.1 hypothetical protein [Listeria booriae]MBC2369937.1 hypothetical protein [Listeria booriae]